jgi:hypothetical protein
MQTKEYTWVEADDLQAILRKVMQGWETNKERLAFIKP